MAIYLVRRLCRMTLPQVGRELGVENYSTVSSVVQRVKTRIEDDRRLLKRLDEIVKKAVKSQKRMTPFLFFVLQKPCSSLTVLYCN